MILVRPYSEEDLTEVQRIFQAMALEYTQPDWGKILVSGVVERDGRITAAAFLRKTAEVYLLQDPEGRKRDKVADLLMLHKELVLPAERTGYSDVHCWLPPQIEERFSKVLMRMGWRKPLWTSYSRDVE